MSVLELRGISKVYGNGTTEVRALDGVHLTVDAGTLAAVMGPSGSGKSTLLTIAGSLEDPTAGEVLVSGSPLSRMSRNAKARLRRRSIGYVFAIARAVVGERRLLLADEPSGALDSANGEAVMDLVVAACRRGVAAVVVTHDAHLASRADRVVHLRDGRITDQIVPFEGSGVLLPSAPPATSVPPASPESLLEAGELS